MINQRKRIFAFNLWLLDLVLTAASFFVAYGLRSLFELEGHTLMPAPVYLWSLMVVIPVWAALLPAFGVYSPRFFGFRDQIVQLSKAIGLAALVMVALQFFIIFDATSRLIVLFTVLVDYWLLVSYRFALFRLSDRGGAFGVRHVVVIGSGEAAEEFARLIERHREWGLQLVGTHEVGETKAVLERGGIDEAIFAVDRNAVDACEEAFLLCEELGVTARLLLNFFPHSTARVELHELDGLPLLTFSTTPSREALLFVRRILDLALASILFAGSFPFLALAALLIKLTSPGPVLFKQERCGLHGRPFTMYKLRTMVDNAEQLRAELEVLNEMDGPVFKSSRDPRITRIGRILRRFSIDEFPQFANVIRGEMSLVGPRPPLPQEVARYQRWQRRRLSMKPGITCLWQVSGRNEVSFEDWMKLDLFYIDNWSLLLDLKILLKTVPVVLLGRGAK